MSRIMRSIRCIALLCCTFIIAVEGLPSEDDTMQKYASGELLAEARQSYTNWYWNKLHHAQVELLSWICSQVRGDENAQTEAQIFSCVKGLSDTDCIPHLERKKSELMKTDGIVMLQLFSGAQSIDSLVSQMFLVLPELLVLVIGIRHKILGNPKDQSLKAIIRELLEKHLFNGASAHTGSFFPAQTLGYNVLGNTITLHSYSLLQWLELFSIHTDVIFLWEAQKTVCDLAGKESSVLRREPPDTVEMIDDLLNLTLSYASKHDAVPWLRVHLKLPGNDEEHYEEVPFPELVSTMETLKKVIAESTSFLNLKHSSVLHELPNFENFLQELETTCTDRETERVKLELEIRKLRTRLDALLMAQRAENTTALKNFITGLKILAVHTSAESVSRHENSLSQHLTLLNEIKKKWDLVPFDDSRISFSSHLQMLRVDIVVLRLLCDSSRALVNTQPHEWAAALVDLGEDEQPADPEQVIGQIVHIEKELQILKSVVTAIPNVPNTELNALVPKIKAIKGDFFFLVDENLHSALSKLKETLSTCREQLDRLKSIYRRKVEDQERILEECFAKRNHGTYTLDSIDETLFSDKRKFDEYESIMLNFHNEVPKLLESLDELQIGYHRAVALLLHCETLNIELNNELRICMQMQLKHLQECAASISLGVTATKTTQLMAALEETRCQTNLIESTTLEVVNCLTRRASFEELRTTWSKKDQDSLQKRIENQEMVITELTTKFQEHYDTTDEQRSGLIRNKIKDLEDKLKSLQGKRAVSEEILASCVILLEAFTQKNMQMLQGVQSSRALVVSWKDQMTVILSHYFIQMNAVSQLEKMHVELTKELEMLRAELEEGRRAAQLLAHDEQHFLYQTQIEQMQHAASQSEYASLQQNLFKLREEQKTYNQMKGPLTEKTKSTAAMKQPQKPIGKFDTTTHQDPGSSESTPKKLSPYIIALIIIGSLILFLLVVCFIYCCCFTAYGAPALSFLVRSSSKYGDKHKNQPAHALSSTGVDDSFMQVVMDDVLEERPHESFL